MKITIILVTLNILSDTYNCLMSWPIVAEPQCFQSDHTFL